jgi:hypothetical protein
MKTSIVAVDIDGVLTNEIEGWDYTNRTPNLKNIELVNRLVKNGNTIILFSARFSQDHDSTIAWLNKHGVKFSRLILEKPHYDFIVDDKCVKLEEI